MDTVLSAKGVVKTYRIGDETIEALKNVSLEIYKGEFSSIVGKSGSGKSTLMHLMGLLDTPTKGDLFVGTQKTTTLSEKKLAQVRNNEIGFVFQAFNLLQRASVLENVLLPLSYSNVPQHLWRARALKVIEQVGLTNRLENKSNELSGGQKQRVAIARALVNDPSIILADEPTGNLDSKTGDEILNLFKKLNSEGKTIVIVTHDDDLAKQTDRQIQIKDGEIVK